jgi:hypothetical protein
MNLKEKLLYLKRTHPEKFGDLIIGEYVLDTDPIKEAYDEIIKNAKNYEDSGNG